MSGNQAHTFQTYTQTLPGGCQPMIVGQQQQPNQVVGYPHPAAALMAPQKKSHKKKVIAGVVGAGIAGFAGYKIWQHAYAHGNVTCSVSEAESIVMTFTNDNIRDTNFTSQTFKLSTGAVVQGFVRKATNSQGAIVVLPGKHIASSLCEIVGLARDSGFTVYGLNSLEDADTVESAVTIARDMVKSVKNMVGKDEPVVVIGEHTGADIAAQICAEEKVSGLVLKNPEEAPRQSESSLPYAEYYSWMLPDFITDRFTKLSDGGKEKLKTVTSPVCIIGDTDEGTSTGAKWFTSSGCGTAGRWMIVDGSQGSTTARSQLLKFFSKAVKGERFADVKKMIIIDEDKHHHHHHDHEDAHQQSQEPESSITESDYDNVSDELEVEVPTTHTATPPHHHHHHHVSDATPVSGA